MNSKLSNKPSRKDRPRSTDKSSKPKRRGDQTPEKSVTPEPSVQGVSDESANQMIGGVLSREDIDSLAVNLNELEKQRPPKRPAVERTSKQVMVRKAVKLKEGKGVEQKNGKIVTVAHPVSPDSQFNTFEKIGKNDPSLDETTAFFEHHILGTLQEFNEQNEQKHQAKKIPFSNTEKTHYSTPTTKVVKGRVFPTRVYQPGMDQSNALSNWERQMTQRRKQQGHLARLLNTSSEMLGMNQNENYRSVQEERHLIDRSIHSIEYGKGYRVGSEFWNQAELIGDEDSGIHMTLTQTERGYPPVVEHVGKPQTIKKETGLDWCDSSSKSYRSVVIHRPWEKSSYLQTRKEELKETINELCPHKPYLQDLEIVGERVVTDTNAATLDENENEKGMDYEMLVTDDATQQYNNPLSSYRDVFPAPIFGPSLTIAGHSASWNGSNHNRLGDVGVSCRVLLEANVNERTVSTLDIYNDGTAAVYYSWKSVVRENRLGTTLAAGKQRFYFDKNSGVILPGDTLKFPFIFKSPNPGMFSEEWQLDTQPVLNGGAAIRVLLRGLALQEDLNVEKREELENELGERQAQQIIESIVQEILDSVRSPERPASPVDAYLTDEESFIRNNPELSYNEEVIQELKQLYHDINPDGEWDLRLSSLRKLIMLSEYEEEDQLDGYLSRLNYNLNSLAFPPRQPFKQEMYSTCYIMLCEMVDDLVTHSDMIRTTMGLPLREMIEDNSIVDGNDKKMKKSDGGRLNVDKKDSRKEKRSGDRPVSSQRMKTPMDKKLVRGNSQNQSRLGTADNQDENVLLTPEEISLDQTTIIAEEQYREKLYFKAYSLVSETVERIAGMFEDINK